MSKFYSTDRDEQSFAIGLDLVGLLEKAVEWIRNNLEPGQVFDNDDLHEWAVENDMFSLDWIAENMDPDEVYKNKAEEKLHEWALDMGYIKAERLVE